MSPLRPPPIQAPNLIESAPSTAIQMPARGRFPLAIEHGAFSTRVPGARSARVCCRFRESLAPIKVSPCANGFLTRFTVKPCRCFFRAPAAFKRACSVEPSPLLWPKWEDSWQQVQQNSFLCFAVCLKQFDVRSERNSMLCFQSSCGHPRWCICRGKVVCDSTSRRCLYDIGTLKPSLK